MMLYARILGLTQAQQEINAVHGQTCMSDVEYIRYCCKNLLATLINKDVNGYDVNISMLNVEFTKGEYFADMVDAYYGFYPPQDVEVGTLGEYMHRQKLRDELSKNVVMGPTLVIAKAIEIIQREEFNVFV